MANTGDIGFGEKQSKRGQKHLKSQTQEQPALLHIHPAIVWGETLKKEHFPLYRKLALLEREQHRGDFGIFLGFN